MEKSAINKFFDHIFCINLERRFDRYEKAKKEFEKHNLEVEFIKAVDGNLLELKPINTIDTIANKGEMGCALSHLKVIKLAKEREYKNCLILEDDAVFPEHVNYFFNDFLCQIKEDWDMIYLGGVHHGDIKNVSENFIKTTCTYTTHAYAIKNTVYDIAIDILSKPNAIADISLSQLHKKYNCYAFIPNLSIQREGFSDVIGKNVDYQI